MSACELSDLRHPPGRKVFTHTPMQVPRQVVPRSTCF